jgi:predicted lipoprotein
MAHSMKNILVIDEPEVEQTVYVLGKKTLKNISMFLDALARVFEHTTEGMALDDDETSEAEKFLLAELCTKPGVFNVDKIKKLLEDENNHLQVMHALACMQNYDFEWRDVTDGIDSDEDTSTLTK